MDTLLLSRKDIEGIIDFKSAYAAARDAYRAFSSGKVVQPPIVSIEIPAHHGELDIKSGYSAMEEIIGVKTASGYPENPRKHGLESLYGFICLYRDAAPHLANRCRVRYAGTRDRRPTLPASWVCRCAAGGAG